MTCTYDVLVQCRMSAHSSKGRVLAPATVIDDVSTCHVRFTPQRKCRSENDLWFCTKLDVIPDVIHVLPEQFGKTFSNFLFATAMCDVSTTFLKHMCAYVWVLRVCGAFDVQLKFLQNADSLDLHKVCAQRHSFRWWKITKLWHLEHLWLPRSANRKFIMANGHINLP